jgi:hypothetical protein
MERIRIAERRARREDGGPMHGPWARPEQPDEDDDACRFWGRRPRFDPHGVSAKRVRPAT